MQAVDTSRAKLIICFVIRRRICFANRSGQVLPRDYSSPVNIWLGHVVCQRRFHHPSPHTLVLDHAQVSHTVFGHISSRSQKVQPTIGRVRGNQLPIRATHTHKNAIDKAHFTYQSMSATGCDGDTTAAYRGTRAQLPRFFSPYYSSVAHGLRTSKATDGLSANSSMLELRSRKQHLHTNSTSPHRPTIPTELQRHMLTQGQTMRI